MLSRFSCAALGAAGALVALAGGCRQRPARPVRPNVLLVTLDTTRADHCSAYGYARPTTPRLERLAGQGVRCETAYAPMATTAPSHATMFTGLLPRAHGLLKNGQALPAGPETLASRLSRVGYRTAAFVSSFAVDHRFGLARGFTTYDDDFGPGAQPPRAWEGVGVAGAFDRNASETRQRVVAWLRAQGYLSGPGKRPPQPFFVWVHIFDPHSPYAPPPFHAALFPPLGAAPTELDRQVAAYDGEIHFADAQVGVLVDKLEQSGLLADTLLVVAGDHGEGLMQHGHMNHGLMIYEEAVRVPLVFHWPRGLPAGRRVTAPVQLVDLTPTVLDLLSLPFPARGPARSLARMLRGEEPPDPRREVLLERRHYSVGRLKGFLVKGDKSAIRVGAWKYIEAPEEGTHELFDLETDPGELRNLYTPSSPEAARLAAALAAWRRSTPAVPSTSVSEEDAQRLRSLGYVQ